MAVIVIVAFNGVRARALDSERHVEIRTIRTALENFNTQNGYYPGVNDAGGSNGVTTLGLTIEQLSAPDAPGLGMSAGYANQHFSTRYKYIAFPNANGTGFLCNDSPCKAYLLGYWAVGEDKDIEYKSF